MAGLEPWISGVGSNRSANCAQPLTDFRLFNAGN